MPKAKGVKTHHDNSGSNPAKKTKKPWIKMEIARIRLDPSQAVLACCSHYFCPPRSNLRSGHQCLHKNHFGVSCGTCARDMYHDVGSS